jgi:uncharacterized protein with HEPN domain
LEDIRLATRKIERYTEGLDEAAFLAEEKTIDAVVRNLEIIGEATKQLPADFKASHPAIPWGQIAGLRNRIVHEYAGVDLSLVWNIVQTALPELAREIAKL